MERLRPDVLFLSKTHLNKARAENLKRRLTFDEVLVSESDGRSGGLIMLWQRYLNVTHNKEVHSNYIDIQVDGNNDSGWRFTGLYGEPSGERKFLTWDYICDLKQRSNLPWLVAGDFNEIMYGHEKEGGNVRLQRCMQAFRDCLR
jgi:hypothetical protein